MLKKIPTYATIVLSLFIASYIILQAFVPRNNHYDNAVVVFHKGGQTDFNVETVCTRAAKIQGLSDRKLLGEKQGMLFVFNHAGGHGIWMKSMRFAIDIVWINEQQQVVHIEQFVKPKTYPRTFASTEPALYVLEILAGQGDEFALGDHVDLSKALPPQATCH